MKTLLACASIFTLTCIAGCDTPKCDDGAQSATSAARTNGSPGTDSASTPTMEDNSTSGAAALPGATLYGTCPARSELLQQTGVHFKMLKQEYGPYAAIQAGSIITDKAAWDALRTQNAETFQSPLPEWEALPYPNVAFLSLDRSLAGCQVRPGTLSITESIQGGLHIDWGLDLQRAFAKANCVGTCAAALGAYALVAFENPNQLSVSQCVRIQPSCEVASSVHEL